jgi:hypothetical protein
LVVDRFDAGSQPVISSMTRSGSVVRSDRVGLPGKRLSVTLGSSSMGPIGSTR